jgi:hypothetical protein
MYILAIKNPSMALRTNEHENWRTYYCKYPFVVDLTKKDEENICLDSWLNIRKNYQILWMSIFLPDQILVSGSIGKMWNCALFLLVLKLQCESAAAIAEYFCQLPVLIDIGFSNSFFSFSAYFPTVSCICHVN